MRSQGMLLQHAKRWPGGHGLVMLMGVAWLLVGCSPSGDNGEVSAPTAPGALSQQQAVHTLLGAYRQALFQEDIDRLHTLLQPEDAGQQARTAASQRLQPQEADGMFQDAKTFREARGADFRTLHLTDLQIPPEHIQMSADHQRVTFLEVESVEDPAELMQQTRLYRTTLHLVQEQTQAVHTLYIAMIRREGPFVHITTRGQLRVGALTRVEVTGSGAPFPLTGVELKAPGATDVQGLTRFGDLWHGLFVPSPDAAPEPLRLRLYGAAGDVLEVQHRYRLQAADAPTVQRMAGTDDTRLFAVAVAPDGTVWAGGDGGGRVYHLPAGAATAALRAHFIDDNPAGRVEDLVIDQLGRVHFLFLDLTGAGVEGNGVVVHDPAHPDVFCRTVNAFHPIYPFHVRDLETGQQVQSPSARLTAATGGDIWLFGSDGGAARVADDFRAGHCPHNAVEVHYAPVLRREDGGLLSNTVPALVASADGTLWFGTALGLTRLRHEQWTSFPFTQDLSVQRSATTLEEFFRLVAQAIFNAQPITAVTFGGVSFVKEFGRAIVKEDLIFSAVADSQGRLWAGTLGGGLRRIAENAPPLHLTRQDGLGSNIIMALAMGPDDTLWAATDEGVSRIQAGSGRSTITHFSSLDGLALPVRDIAVDAAGIVWLATDGGLFRILPQGGQLQGVVRDPEGRPVAGVDVLVQGTPFRAVTDAEGHFRLVNVPPGEYRLQFDGHLVVPGSFTTTVHAAAVAMGEQALEAVVLAPVEGHQLLQVSGGNQQGVVGGMLPHPLVVAVLDRQGRPVPDMPVTFAVTAGAGHVSTTQPVRTDGQGQASTGLTLGKTAGENQVTATGAGLNTVVFTATGLADRASARLTRVSGNNQVATPGETLPAPLVVQLEDQFGNPLEGEILTAEIIQGEAELVAFQSNPAITKTVETDAEGQARFDLRVSPCAAEGTVITEVSAPAIPEAEQVQFLTAVGFAAPSGITVENNGALVVADIGLNVVLQVDPRSGARTIVSGADIGSGPPFGTLADVALEASGSLVVVYGIAPHTAERFIAPAVARIDPRSGARTIVSGCTEQDTQGACVGELVGSGVLLNTPFGIAVEADGSLVVADSGLNAVVRVHPVNGNRTIVSDSRVGSGPLFRNLFDIAVEADGSLVVVDAERGLTAVVRIDPATGARSIVSGSNTTFDGEPPFIWPRRLAVEADGSLVVTDIGLNAVVRVHPESGRRTVVSGCPQVGCRTEELKGDGPPFVNLTAIAVEADGSLVLGDLGPGVILRVDPSSGDRSIVSEARIGAGPSFRVPTRLALEAEGTLVVIDISLNAVIRVDPVCRARAIVSGSDVGSGPPFISLADIAVEADGFLVVVHGGGAVSDDLFIPPAVVRVDPHSGARTVISGGSDNLGGGPLLQNPFAMAVQADDSLVIVDRGGFDASAGSTPPAIMRIDPHTGDRTIISGGVDDIGQSELPLRNPSGIAVQADGSLIVVDCGGMCLIPPLVLPFFPPAIVRVHPISGDRTVVLGPPDTSAPDWLFAFPAAVAIEADGSLIVAGGLAFTAALRRVNPENGNHMTISGTTPSEGIFGAGPPFVAPFGVAVAADNTLMVADLLLGAVVKVNPQTGNRTIVSK